MDENVAEEEVQTQDWPVSLTDMEAKTLIKALADTLAEENAEKKQDKNWLLKKPRHKSKSLANTQSQDGNRNPKRKEGQANKGHTDRGESLGISR